MMSEGPATRITLTFDNGPTPHVTDRVLDLLDEFDVRAWFFVVGEKLLANRDLTEQARDRGHAIGNHTFSHTIPLGERPGDEAVEEITRTEAIIADLACRPRVFRPFGRGGAIGPHLFGSAAAQHLRDEGYSVAMWNNVPRDWIDGGWVERALETIADQSWSLVVLHDIESACLERLPIFLAALRTRGVEIAQELPPELVPLQAGEPTASYERFF
jgi:peptidoglycan/xylan/chitin deacetylase (PgdA/CDA1 family)